jgi:hypothetical protein
MRKYRKRLGAGGWGQYSIGIGSALALLMFYFLPDHWKGGLTLDMQKNKFPPNHLFFLFSSLWVVLLLSACKAIEKYSFVEYLSRSWLLKPFMNYGYSIYLWQGISYSISSHLGNRYGLPFTAKWIIAIGGAVLLGKLFSKVEILRLSRR